MLKVGLTGGIGSGKSTITTIFREAGFPIIDADIVAREVLDIYPEILTWVRKEFGDGFFDWQGKFLRRQFGNYIFKYQKERKKYEDKILPYIKKEIFKKFEAYSNTNEIVILDAPTLIENNLQEQMDYVILVWVDRKTQIERLVKRDNLMQKDIITRINAQMPLEDKKAYADFIIDNSTTMDSTILQVKDIIEILRMN